METTSNTPFVLSPSKKYYRMPLFGMGIALFIMAGYLFTGDLSISDVVQQPLAGKSLLFIGTVLIVLIYGVNLLLQYNYVVVDDQIIKRVHRFPKREYAFAFDQLESWIPVSIVRGRVVVDRNDCTQLEVNFKDGSGIKLTADYYEELDLLLTHLREHYPGYFIDILEGD